MGIIYKVNGYIVSDIDKELIDTENVNDLELRLPISFTSINSSVVLQHFHVDSIVADDITTDSPIMIPNCDLKYCEDYFPPAPSPEKFDRIVTAGEKYRHFKEGKIVEVITVAKHSENPSSWFVVYKCDENEVPWIRPYEMFISKVDKDKYPDATQEYRFEKIEV